MHDIFGSALDHDSSQWGSRETFGTWTDEDVEIIVTGRRPNSIYPDDIPPGSSIGEYLVGPAYGLQFLQIAAAGPADGKQQNEEGISQEESDENAARWAGEFAARVTKYEGVGMLVEFLTKAWFEQIREGQARRETIESINRWYAENPFPGNENPDPDGLSGPSAR